MIRTHARAILSWLPAALYMTLIWGVSAIPAGHLPKVTFLVHDKLLHFTEYFVLGVLVYFACHVSFAHLNNRFRYLLAFVISVSWGIIDECHQYYVPKRIPSVMDWLADTTGVAFALSLIALLITLRTRRRIPDDSVINHFSG
ncbi:MAG: VanZ family protein [Myxococcales bacterium]|nr:MAG: VanZ family protein [Myxococcales bacterium]